MLEILIFLGVRSEFVSEISLTSLSLRAKNGRSPRALVGGVSPSYKKRLVRCRPLLIGISLTRYTYKFPIKEKPPYVLAYTGGVGISLSDLNKAIIP